MTEEIEDALLTKTKKERETCALWRNSIVSLGLIFQQGTQREDEDFHGSIEWGDLISFACSSHLLLLKISLSLDRPFFSFSLPFFLDGSPLPGWLLGHAIERTVVGRAEQEEWGKGVRTSIAVPDDLSPTR